MDGATARRLARRLQWAVVVTLIAALIGAAYSVELWIVYWWYPIGIGARLTLLAVVAALFVAVHIQTRP